MKSKKEKEVTKKAKKKGNKEISSAKDNNHFF